MEIVEPSATLLGDPDGTSLLRHVERCGRVCYQSLERMTQDSHQAFVRMLLANGHEAVLEHVSLTMRLVCDRGVSHELVRHRLASYCQESTRFVRYQNIQVLCPPGLQGEALVCWHKAMLACETAYQALLAQGCTPQIARSVLPSALKTEVVMTANLREWRHFFALRLAKAAHPQMRQLAAKMLVAMQEKIPIVFEAFVPEGDGDA